MTRWIAWLLSTGSRRPRTTLVVSVLGTILLLAGLWQLKSDTSLDAMFPENDPAAITLASVLSRFRSADELIVMVSLPDSDTQPQPQKMLDFAKRFAHAMQTGPAAGLCDGVIYRAGPDIQQFIEHKLAPAGLFYLSDAQFQAARQRLTPASIREQVAHDQDMLSQPGPAGGAIAKALIQDPLNLHEFLLPQLTAAKPFSTFQNSDAQLSPDGRALLIRVLGNKPTTDLDYSRALTHAAEAATAAADPHDLRVIYTGAYAIADDTARSIRRDAINSSISSVLLMFAIFAIVYRRPIRMFHLAFVPVALGTLWGFGLYGWILHGVSPIAAVIGGVLAGMGIDYSVLYLTRYESLRAAGAQPHEAASQTISDIGTAVFAAWITSVAGFLAIGASSLRALRDFSILGTLGLGGCFLAAVFILPAWLTCFDRATSAGAPRHDVRFSLSGMLQIIHRHRRMTMGLCIAITLVSLILVLRPGTVLLPETDLTVMHPQPSAPLDAETEMSRRFGIAPGTLMIHLQADNSNDLLAQAAKVQQRLTMPAMHDAGVAGVYGLATWLPDPVVVAERSHAFSSAEADSIVANFKNSLQENSLNVKPFLPYANFLHALLTQTAAPTIADLATAPSLSRELLPRISPADATEAVTLVFLSHRTEDRVARDRAIAAINAQLTDIPGSVLTGLPVVSRDAELAVRSELPRLFWVAVALVSIYLLVHFRSLKGMMLSLLPGVLSIVILAAFVRCAGIKLNLINFIALPLLIGIDVDYGIYLVSLARRSPQIKDGERALSSGALAVMVCASSMVAGYASLVTISIPAVRLLGIVVAVGVAACLAIVYLMLVPLLLSDRARQQR